MADQKRKQHVSRSNRTRGKIKRVSTDRPRLSVFRSSKNISAQVIDDVAGKTELSWFGLKLQNRKTIISKRAQLCLRTPGSAPLG